MRQVVSAHTAPPDYIHLVGVLGGEALAPVDLGGQTPEDIGFEGRPKETLLLAGPSGRALLVGLGDEADADTIRLAAGAAGKAAPTKESVATTLHSLDVDGALEAFVEGFLAGSYRFNAYRSGEVDEPGSLVLVGDTEEATWARSLILAEAVYRARDWVNRPPRDKAPQILAEEMASYLSDGGFEVEVWDEDRIEEENLGGLLGVAAGSDRPPRMLVAHGGEAAAERGHLAWVGKGIVFDSGGLSIKTTEGMATMKGDMAGAATVVAAAGAVGRLGEGPAVSVYVPLTDNMSGGSAMKPGDVLRMRNGKTVEVLNTDAEGRLVLADALSLAVESTPDLIVDVATLTGASRVALGDEIAAVFSPTDEPRDRVMAAASAAGERVWPLPLPPDQRHLIDSSVADMKNTGGRYGGAIAAALLLAEFTGDVPWAHLDIAGPSYFREEHPLGPKGGSGFGVTTLVALAGVLAEGRRGS